MRTRIAAVSLVAAVARRGGAVTVGSGAALRLIGAPAYLNRWQSYIL